MDEVSTLVQNIMEYECSFDIVENIKNVVPTLKQNIMDQVSTLEEVMRTVSTLVKIL